MFIINMKDFIYFLSNFYSEKTLILKDSKSIEDKMNIFNR